MFLAWPNKDPDEVLDYEIDWSARVLTDTILTSVWTIPSGITKNSDSKTAATTTAWLSGGTLGTTYEILNRIVTAGGRTMDQTVKIKIKAK
jgi:hypothetical protein